MLTRSSHSGYTTFSIRYQLTPNLAQTYTLAINSYQVKLEPITSP
jgi:hypothetical protein